MADAAGTFCFVYTDLSGSSALWSADPARALRTMHDVAAVTESCASSRQGRVFKSLGDGHALVFQRPADAVGFALDLHSALKDRPFKVRAAIHQGSASPTENDFQGAALIVVARLIELGTSDQILVTGEITQAEPVNRYHSRGSATLRGLPGPIAVFQLLPPGVHADAGRLRGASLARIPALSRKTVGRAREIKDVAGQINAKSQRLTSIAGFGGVGKTTLAQVVADSTASSFEHGVVWVECEFVASDSDLTVAVDMALRTAWPEISPDSTWSEELPKREVLLVLDCCEKMAARGVSPDALLRACPQLTVLATSRVIFGSDFEHVVSIYGLSDLSRKRPDLSAAVSLFESAARQVDPGFKVSRANVTVVRKIVKRVETVPLAIILVASRLRHSSIGRVAEMVDACILDAAKSNRRAGRHASLTTVVEASFALLNPQESRELAGLAVFAGWFSSEDASSVLGVCPEVERLADNSLFHSERSALVTHWRMLDPVREYARLSQDPAEWDTLTRRHAAHYAARAAVFEDLVARDDWARVAKVLPRLLPDLRQALDTATATQDTETLTSLAARVARPYAETGLATDLEAVASATFKLCESDDHDQLKATILGLQAITARRSGNLALATSLLTERLGLADRLGDPDLAADSLGDALDLALLQQDRGRIQALVDEWSARDSLPAIPENLDQTMLLARCHTWLGDKTKGRELYQNALERLRDRGEGPAPFYVQYSIIEMERALGNGPQAMALARSMLDTAVTARLPPFAHQALRQIGLTSLALGETSRLPKVVACLSALPSGSVRQASVQAREWRLLMDTDGAEPAAIPGESWTDACRRHILDEM